MAAPKFTSRGRDIDALIDLATKQPPPAAAPAEPRGAQRAGSEFAGNMGGDYPPPRPGPEPSALGVRSEKRWPRYIPLEPPR